MTTAHVAPLTAFTVVALECGTLMAKAATGPRSLGPLPSFLPGSPARGPARAATKITDVFSGLPPSRPSHAHLPRLSWNHAVHASPLFASRPSHRPCRPHARLATMAIRVLFPRCSWPPLDSHRLTARHAPPSNGPDPAPPWPWRSKGPVMPCAQRPEPHGMPDKSNLGRCHGLRDEMRWLLAPWPRTISQTRYVRLAMATHALSAPYNVVLVPTRTHMAGPRHARPTRNCRDCCLVSN